MTVPGLTFANSMLCLSSGTREFLERRQREVGRLALETHRTATNEAVQREIRWSLFEAWKAGVKLGFETGSWALGGEQWPPQFS